VKVISGATLDKEKKDEKELVIAIDKEKKDEKELATALKELEHLRHIDKYYQDTM
jgi:hypothetical protein